MRKPHTHTFSSIVDEVFDALRRVLRYSMRLIREMSPPALLGAAVLLALLLSMLPLAIVLFAAFMVAKVAVGACVIGNRRQRNAPQEPHA
nr:hypothetical protein [uncultured Duganella sp.]